MIWAGSAVPSSNAFVRATLRILPLIDSYDFNRYGFELGVRF